MKRAIIYLNGDRTDVSRVKQYIDDETMIVGVDGGTNHILALSLKPDVIIGDLDSLTKNKAALLKKKATEIITYPRDKDYTDGELAIKYAIKKGCKEIIVTGLLGTRIDHLLGNILLLLKKEYEKVSIKIVEGNQEIYLIRNHAVIHGKKGDTISFIPIDKPVNSANSTGLQYDLGKYKLSIQGNRGISNVMTKNRAVISLQKGTLLVIHTSN